MRGLIFGAAVVALVAGCGEGDPFSRQAVSGTVTYKGKPLVYGQIEFYPSDGQKTPLTLEIKDGKFAADKVRGLSAGKYSVRISGFDGPLPASSPDEPGKMMGSMPKAVVPEKYNTKSALTADIKSGDKNELTFTLD
jgi:hypothetical protein